MSAVELYCEDSGGRSEAVVLSHAIGCDRRMWSDLVAALARRWRVLNIDSRGHGKSPVPPRPYTLGAMADDVARVLDRVGIARAHWVGLSMGGMVGQAFALAHPERLGRLVLANTTSSYGPDGGTTWANRIRLVEEGGLAAIRDAVAERYFSADFRARHADVVRQVMDRVMETNAQGYLGCCDAIAELDFLGSLERIQAPTLVIAGALDAGTPPAMAQAMVERIPDARLEVLQGAAHLSAVEKPTAFATLVAGFLADH